MIVATVILWLAAVVAVVVVLCVALTALIARKIEADLPPLGQVVDVDGAKIRYIDQGSGPPLVLIHGLAGQMRHWTYSMVDRLEGDFRVIVLDRPGCGYSQMAPGASPRLSAQATTVAGFIRALDLDRPLLVGHSLGGALSLAVALDHRAAIGGLALISPLTHPTDDVPAAFSLMATVSPLRRWLTAWILATPATILGGRAAEALVFGPDPVKADFATRGGNMLMLRPTSFVATSAEMCAIPEDLPSMAARYASLDCPVGLLFGTHDQILDPEIHGEALTTKIPGATIDYIEGCGHMPPQAWPDRTAEFIRAMAARVAL